MHAPIGSHKKVDQFLGSRQIGSSFTSRGVSDGTSTLAVHRPPQLLQSKDVWTHADSHRWGRTDLKLSGHTTGLVTASH
jgi:hypothetical protein